VKASQRRPYSRILAAVGPESESEEAALLNRKILDWASSMAALEGSELHVVHALEPFREGISRGRAGVSDAEFRDVASRIRKARKQWLMGLFAPYNPASHPGRIHLVTGSAAAAIPKLVRLKKMNLLVMGTVCRTGVPGFLIGNTAERILNHVDCSVLTVKPDGFVSPITTRKT
jgi:nucleotide-binding universal stress UspA family protein